jgi:hypothetical protein
MTDDLRMPPVGIFSKEILGSMPCGSCSSTSAAVFFFMKEQKNWKLNKSPLIIKQVH